MQINAPADVAIEAQVAIVVGVALALIPLRQVRSVGALNGPFMTQSSGKARYVTFFRDTAVKLPVKRIIVGPADGADERSRALSRRLQ
jgi:hypothetical protein